MNDEKLEKAKVLKENIEGAAYRVRSLTEKSYLEGHPLDESSFEKIVFQNRGNHVDLRVNSNNTETYCGKISNSGYEQLYVLITAFRNAVASVYENELNKLEQEYAKL